MARALGVKEVIIPPASGASSAFGFLAAPLSFEQVQSMPVELIVDEVESGLTGKKSSNVAQSSIMGGAVNQDDVAHFMRSI